MKSTTALSFFILAMAGPASILADVTVWDQEITVVTVTAGDVPPAATPTPALTTSVPPPAPPASSSSSPPPPPEKVAVPVPASSSSSGGGNGGGSSNGTPGSLTSSNSKICINFSGNNDFHWLNTGTWGSNSGSGTSSASQCFDLTANAGMFICESECQNSGDSATAKYTKLECTFGGDWQNCDISLVDGFSLPLECTIPGASPEKIGGLTDLDSLTPCPSGGDDNTCKNSNAYMGAESDVAQYFQNANGGHGGNYCVYQTCSASSDSFFSGTPTISCQVGTRGSTSTSKRGLAGAVVDAPAALSKREGTSHAHGHRHRHIHAHARGLKDVVA